MVIKENEVTQFIEGNFLVLDEDNAQEVTRYNEGEIKGQRIPFESIKYHFISFFQIFPHPRNSMTHW